MTDRPRGPLSDVVVVDLTHALSGPYCTLLMAELGARVIKIERAPIGDAGRNFAPFAEGKPVFFPAHEPCALNPRIVLASITGYGQTGLEQHAGVACGRINTVGQAIEDAQTHAHNMIVDAAGLRVVGNPINMTTAEDPPTRSPAPDFNADGPALRTEFAR